MTENNIPTPPPIPENNGNEQNTANLNAYDPRFDKTEDEVATEIIQAELKKNSLDDNTHSTRGIEKKKMTATLICAGIGLILILLMKFFHMFPCILPCLIVLSIIILWMYGVDMTLSKSLLKEMQQRPDEEVENLLAYNMYDVCERRPWKRYAVYLGIVVLLPLLLFMKPHIFYENAPDGVYVRYYTEGVIFGNNEIVIPPEVDGVTVKGIRGDVFCNTNLRSIVLPGTIDTIRGHAFEGCEDLEEINLPKNLEYIGGYAFAGCESLTKLDIPDGVSTIGGNAFEGCTKLRNVSLPSAITEIHGDTFHECKSLEEIDIPEGVTRIGGSAFRDCESLMRAALPSTLHVIGSSAFRNCGNLKSVTIPADCMVDDRAFKESPTKVVRE